MPGGGARGGECSPRPARRGAVARARGPGRYSPDVQVAAVAQAIAQTTPRLVVMAHTTGARLRADAGRPASGCPLLADVIGVKGSGPSARSAAVFQNEAGGGSVAAGTGPAIVRCQIGAFPNRHGAQGCPGSGTRRPVAIDAPRDRPWNRRSGGGPWTPAGERMSPWARIRPGDQSSRQLARPWGRDGRFVRSATTAGADGPESAARANRGRARRLGISGAIQHLNRDGGCISSPSTRTRTRRSPGRRLRHRGAGGSCRLTANSSHR